MTTGRINQVNILHTNQDENFAPSTNNNLEQIHIQTTSLYPKVKQFNPNVAFLKPSPLAEESFSIFLAQKDKLWSSLQQLRRGRARSE